MNFSLFDKITARIGEDNKPAIEGIETKTLTEAKNDYYTDQLPLIPAGTPLKLDFAGDCGCYAMAEVNGTLHKVKFTLEGLNAIDWSFLNED
tara:strand:- start:100 stop:375 length:276 start_codon:yes stop_codon:yes gene_type:complete